ncbi:MAG: hypothetical protein JWM11_4415 [Planctomycetaceae bacterium]|nr:hypothetical protein [Planctomycetaceae bacterium]
METAERDELLNFCEEVQEHTENNIPYVHLRRLTLPANCTPEVVDALLCLGLREGYPTRLFVSEQITSPSSKAANWGAFSILGRSWQSWSWNNVPANQRPAEVLASHLRTFV